jgi:hypothetical protein
LGYLSWATITKRVFIDHWVVDFWDTLEIKISNPDEIWGRYFYIYIDGILRKTEITSGTTKTYSYNTLDGGWWFAPGNTYEVQFVIYSGGEGRGWALEYARITWSEGGANAIDYVTNEVFPITGTYRTIYKTSFVQDYWQTNKIKLKMKINNPSQWIRWIYVYNNGEEIGRFLASVGTFTYEMTLGSYTAISKISL